MMSIVIDHSILSASDPVASGRFLTELLGIAPAEQLGPFTVIRLGPSTLDFLAATGPIQSRHFAFKVSEDRFDAIFARIRDRGLSYWADPSQRQAGEINRWDDGRGLYFADPDGHSFEILTVSYGAHGCAARYPHPLLDCPADPAT